MVTFIILVLIWSAWLSCEFHKVFGNIRVVRSRVYALEIKVAEAAQKSREDGARMDAICDYVATQCVARTEVPAPCGAQCTAAQPVTGGRCSDNDMLGAAGDPEEFLRLWNQYLSDSRAK